VAGWSEKAGKLMGNDKLEGVSKGAGSVVSRAQVATNAWNALHGDTDAAANLAGTGVSKAGGKLVGRAGETAVKWATDGASKSVGSAGTVAAVGAMAGEGVGGILGRCIDGERGRVAGENVGGAAGAAASGALYGAYLGSVGGPIGAAIGGGVGILGWGVGKTASFCTGLIMKVFKGVAMVRPETVHEIGESKTWSYFCADNFNSAKKYALEQIAKDPENRFATVTHWTGNHMTVHVYKLRRDCLPEFDWAAGDHTLLTHPEFKFQGLCTAKFLSIGKDGGLTDRTYYGGLGETFVVVPVPDFGEGCFMLRNIAYDMRRSLLGLGRDETYECVEKREADLFQQRKLGGVVLQSGHAICLRNQAHGNHYVRCYQRAGRGFGVSTAGSADGDSAKFTIWKWSGDGAIHSGDEVYLKNPAHGDEHVECFGKVAGGFGVSTNRSKENSAKFTIWKWSGDGRIQSGDDIYLRSPSHNNEYLRCFRHVGDGYGVSTTASRDGQNHDESPAKFSVWHWAQRTHGSGGGSVVLYSMRCKKYITNTKGNFHPGTGTSMHVVGLGHEGKFALMLP